MTQGERQNKGKQIIQKEVHFEKKCFFGNNDKIQIKITYLNFHKVISRACFTIKVE